MSVLKKINYISRGIVSNVLEREVVHFAPLYGNEFGVLIYKFFIHCEKFCLSEGSLHRLHVNWLLNLSDVIP